MILQVLTHSWQIPEHSYAKPVEMGRRPDTGKHEELKRSERSGTRVRSRMMSRKYLVDGGTATMSS